MAHEAGSIRVAFKSEILFILKTLAADILTESQCHNIEKIAGYTNLDKRNILQKSHSKSRHELHTSRRRGCHLDDKSRIRRKARSYPLQHVRQ